MAKKFSTAIDLPTERLNSDEFQVDEAVNLIVKNELLANTLKAGLSAADEAETAISVGVVVDL